jgi:hypothetical protein
VILLLTEAFLDTAEEPDSDLQGLFTFLKMILKAAMVNRGLTKYLLRNVCEWWKAEGKALKTPDKRGVARLCKEHFENAEEMLPV